jgi:trk system potassium uptake protein TrkA
MHTIIVGCGRVGSTVARELDADGHSVVIIDRKPEAFRRLGDNFGGNTMTGIGFDRDLLIGAGITSECAVVAVTNGDNSNILVARVAREMFGVERVVARINDPKRAKIYERLGVSTVAAVAWASNRTMQYVLPRRGTTEWSDPTSTFHLAERRVSAELAGTKVSEIGVNVAILVRNGTAQVAAPTMLLQENDLIHILGTADNIESFDNGSSTAGAHS